MEIRFSQPFQKLTGTSLFHLDLSKAITLKELLQVLGNEFPTLERFSGFQTDDSLSAHAMFVRAGRILLLLDRLEMDDQIEIFLPVSGG
ncbi:MoaD/ThiS family protein [Acidobacteriota bacterium]